MKLGVWFSATEEERALVDGLLDVAWGKEALDAEGVLSFFPRKELAAMDAGWSNVQATHVQLTTAGANHVGWSTLPEHIQVGVTPGATGPFIAEYVLAGVLHWARGLGTFTKQIQAGHFQVGQPVRALQGLKVGLLGFGGIGQATARLLGSLGCKLRAVNRTGESAHADLVDVLGDWSTRQDVASWADVLVVCVPLVRETEGVVNPEMLGALGDGLLVNVARGLVVDEPALYHWLQQGGYAILDVWWQYPKAGHPFQLPFHELDNVVMTPHNSPNVPGFRLAMIRSACLHLRTLQETGSLPHPVQRSNYTDRGDGR